MGIGDLLEKWKLKGLTLDEKLGVLEHYDIKFDRREIARELSNLVGGKVRDAKRFNYTKAIESATKEEVERAVHKTLDRYVKEAEARFRTELTKRFKEKVLGKEKAAKLKYRWISVIGDSRRCPDCRKRHGQEETMKEWEIAGIPRSGATVCQTYCRCRLIALDEPEGGEKVEKEPDAPITGKEARIKIEKDTDRIQGFRERLEKKDAALIKRMDETIKNAEGGIDGWMKDPAAVKEMNKIAELLDGNTAKRLALSKRDAAVVMNALKTKNPVGMNRHKAWYSRSKKAGIKPIKRPNPNLKNTVDEAEKFVGSIVESDLFGDKFGPEGEMHYTVFSQRKGARASAGGYNVNLPNDTSVGTAVHEFGHIIEDQGIGIRGKALAFLKRRADADPKGLLPIYGNKPGPGGIVEKGWKDKFINHYCGKRYTKEEYGYEATEIVSMGIQFLYESPRRFLKLDPEYFEFIVDLLKGY
jgi:hypothetical protein